jgi:hypothetical protein
MTKIFYDHLTIIEEVTAELDLYKLSADEREEIIRIIDETMHHRVLDLILTHLPKEKHRTFLEGFHKDPADQKHLDYLRREISAEIDQKIAAEAKKVKQEILAEIKRARKTSGR